MTQIDSDDPDEHKKAEVDWSWDLYDVESFEIWQSQNQFGLKYKIIRKRSLRAFHAP